MGRPAKYPVQYFNGVAFYRKPRGYYKNNFRDHGGKYMHRVVWEHYNGAIPEGYHVHHRNGDRSDNRLENLELLSASEHASHHGRERARNDPAGAAAHMARIRPAASAWHASTEGREWHREHALRAAARQVKVEMACTFCGKSYMGLPSQRKRGFCGQNCQNKARRRRLNPERYR